MKIVLFRHGEPTKLSNNLIEASSFAAWIVQYNFASIKPDSQPSKEALAIASEASLIISSQLTRSKESAVRLSSGQPIQERPCFHEAGLPSSTLKLAKVKATPRTWAVVFRVLWYLGYANGTESKSEAQARSKKATIELKNLARKHGTVVFVGHAILNRFIAKNLALEGFVGPKYPSSKYWSFSIYERHSDIPAAATVNDNKEKPEEDKCERP